MFHIASRLAQSKVSQSMKNGIAPCRGCRVGERPCRFGADDLVALSPQEGLAHLVCPRDFDGGPEVAHGGWIAGVFDDVLGRFLNHWDVKTVTASLSVNYLLPVPTGQPLTVGVRILSREGRRITMAGALRLRGEERDRATAHGVWVETRPDHFERHRDQLSAYLTSSGTDDGPV
jgi:acyl-coenzyme A thioesterase PaaI-like protein